MKTYHNPHPPSKLPRVLSPQEAQELLDHTDNSSDRYAVRDSAILHVLYATGARAGELCAMTLDRYDAPNRRILITGKYHRERWAFLTPRAARALDTWIAVRHRFAGPHDYIFVNMPGGAPLADRVLRFIVSYRAEAAFGPHFRVHPHMLRHSIATHMTDNGIAIDDLARILGHASLSSTLIYQNVAPNRLAETHAAHHPETCISPR